MQLVLERCTIRAWRPDDAASLAKHANNRRVWLGLRDLFPHPYTTEDANEFLRRATKEQLMTNFCIDVGQSAVGGIGIRIGQDVHRHVAELGFWLGQEFWGHGIMTEVIPAFVDYCFEKFPLYRIYAEPYANNPVLRAFSKRAALCWRDDLRTTRLRTENFWIPFFTPKQETASFHEALASCTVCDDEQARGQEHLITGASQGLGREMTLRFAREGAAGLSLVARHADKLNAVRDEVLKIAPKIEIVAVEADVSKPRDIERIVAMTLAQFKGVLDVLVNNASTIGPSPMPYLLDYPVEDFREVLDTNLIGPFLLIKNALPAMIERGGSIINVTSDAGQVGYPGWGAYGISKFGLEGMSQTWASELEESGVRVNWVDPGSMNTAMHRAAEPEEDPSEWANPTDVTDVFVFLASNESKGVTGKRFQAQEDWRAQINHEAHEAKKS